MHPFKKLVLGMALVGLVVGVGACGDDDDDQSPCTTATVTVTPGTATIEIGATQQLTGAALDASGNACGTLTWSSGDDLIATVSTSGLVTGVSAGEVDITASAGGQTGVSTITVNPVNMAPQIVMTAPSTSDPVLPGSVVSITWTATDDVAVTGVDLSYTADGVSETAIATDLMVDEFDWTTPMETLYGVVIKGVATDEGGLTGEDETDNIFAVVQFSAAGYVQGVTCQDCHATYYTEVFEMSGHPYKLNKVEGAAPTYPNGKADLPTPVGTTWDNFSYVIGGYGWKARYLDLDGYIYTPVAGENQWNLLPETWTDYNPDGPQTHPYDCGRCHTTGWVLSDDGDATNNQDGLEGLVGTFEEQGISCEQCHGAGATHVSTQLSADITNDPSSDLCGTCHNRGGANADIPASGGFIRHHEQYNEWANSSHFAGASCNTCHDPHLGTRYDNGGFINSCVTCHPDEAATNAHLVPIGDGNDTDSACITCHMSQATKSAVAENSFVGDVQTHIFRINPDPVGKDYFFSADLLSVATADEGVTLDFACYQCHTDPITLEGGGFSQKSLGDLSVKATGIHTP